MSVWGYNINDQFRGQRPPPELAQDVTDAAVILEDHERVLCSLIREHPLVVGCFAWLSSFPVLDALSSTWCDIVLGAEPYHITAEKMRAMGGNRQHRASPDGESLPIYEDITGEELGSRQIDVLRRTMTSRFHYIPSVRGAQPYEKSLMHSKFLLLGTPIRKTTTLSMPGLSGKAPSTFHYASVCKEAFTGVWLGSYNPTSNARNSVETALILRSPTLAGRLFDEYRRLRLAAQPLACTPPYTPPPIPDDLRRLFGDGDEEDTP